MKRPGLIHGILVAALLSLVAPLLYRITAVIVSPPLASKLVRRYSRAAMCSISCGSIAPGWEMSFWVQARHWA